MENQIEATTYSDNRQCSVLAQLKSAIAQQLATGAEAIHRQTAHVEHPSELSQWGEQTADWLKRSANYVNELQPQKVKADLEMTIKQNPGRSLLIAGLAGIVLGNLLRRR